MTHIVRDYRADGRLTVTRDEETNEHIVESRGRDRGDKWTRRIPAVQTTVEPGEHLWSIPDNWRQSYRLKSESGSDKGIYQIPDSGESVLVRLCHENNRITDAYHVVEEVGSVTWTARADVNQEAVSDALEFVDDYSDEFHDSVSDVLQYIRENPRAAVEDAEEAAELYASECVDGWNGIPASEFDPFHISFRSQDGVVSHPEYGYESEVMQDVRHIIDNFGIIPPSPLVSVTVQ